MTLEITKINNNHIQELMELFGFIEHDEDAKNFFYPHPFTYQHASFIANNVEKDIYVLAKYNSKILSYGMLRGWDEGYQVPSLGIYVVQESRSIGLGKFMLEYLHLSAKLRGAISVRLKVHRNNERALRLYQKIGYKFDLDSEEHNPQILGQYIFPKYLYI